MVRRGPDVSKAARSGTPAMATIAPRAPISVPVQAVTTAPEVVATQVPENSTALDKNPDARQTLLAKPADGKEATETAPAETTVQAPPVTNHPFVPKKKEKKKKKATDTSPQAQPADPKTTDTASSK